MVVERKGNWWNLGDDPESGKPIKVNGRPDFVSLPSTCQIDSLVVEVRVEHTYVGDLKMTLEHGEHSMTICTNSNCEHAVRKELSVRLSKPHT